MNKEQNDLGDAASEQAAGLSAISPAKAPEDAASIPNAEMRCTLRFEAYGKVPEEVFAMCKYTDVAETMAMAVASRYPKVVLLVPNDIGFGVQRFEAAMVQQPGVVTTYVTRSASDSDRSGTPQPVSGEEYSEERGPQASPKP